MRFKKPAYYDEFRCLAGVCPDSCCQEWDVQVDSEAARRYLALQGPLGDRLRAVLKEGDGEYTMEIQNRRCPMWRDDGLCRIQAELGHDGLCRVCQEFPRLRHDYGDFVELGLELSCPEAARLMLKSPAAPDIEWEEAGGEAPEYDPVDMEILLRTRKKALELLAHRPLPEALALLLLYGYRAQDELDGEEEVDSSAESELDFARRIAGAGNEVALLGFYNDLEVLTPRWERRLAAPLGGEWPEELRAMARCGIERYWLQAISDFDLVCRVKLIVAGCILVGLLGGDPVETAQLYSKEIDNSIENVEAILDGAYAAPALTDANLLGILLER